ncbi:MAG: SUMF1/EgtB/PvdO family nonheme iron enzyme [Treponema sp.]
MRKFLKKNHKLVLMISALALLAGWSAFAKESPEMVKQEEGFYYGYGKGSTVEEAALEAKKDLVSNALTETLRATNPTAARVNANEQSINDRLGDIKPYVQSKDKKHPSLTYRMKIADWDKKEKAYSEKLRTELTLKYNDANASSTGSDKINKSLEILKKLADVGETDLLTLQAEGTELVSSKVESICSAACKNITFTLSVKDGFVDSNTKFSVEANDKSGKAVAGLTLTASWEIPELFSNSTAEVSESISLVKTDSNGIAFIDFPTSSDFINRSVTLVVSTALSKSVPLSSLRKIDAENSIDGCYVQCDDIENYLGFVTVPEGEFNAGSVAQDTRAGKKEASHVVKTDSYKIETAPVTNAQYAAFLHATRSENIPEYFYNSDYNQGNQPVVGVSAKDAEAYAEWLSSQTGKTYRLPKEEEWEKAARAGKEVIYPWGDTSPADNANANYKGNGIYSATSPVGSFENGKNEWGLVDMAGNVWEWTSSSHSGDDAARIVKGGSWMDGPMELRISNFRSVNSSECSADIGFRLVMEVTK